MTVFAEIFAEPLASIFVGYDKEFKPIAYREDEELSEYAKEIRRNLLPKPKN